LEKNKTLLGVHTCYANKKIQCALNSVTVKLSFYLHNKGYLMGKDTNVSCTMRIELQFCHLMSIGNIVLEHSIYSKLLHKK